MKVIKNNHQQFVFPMRVTCSGCKSVLEVEKADVKSASGDERTSTNGYRYVSCPLCKAQTKVTPKAAKK